MVNELNKVKMSVGVGFVVVWFLYTLYYFVSTFGFGVCGL
jgi:hypothetical protein